MQTLNRAEPVEVLKECFIPTPLGRMRAVTSDEGLLMLGFIDDSPAGDSIDRVLLHRTIEPRNRVVLPGGHRHLSALQSELAEYLAGRRTEFSVPLAPFGTAFEKRAWDYLRTIPFGQTRSYGEQARAIGAASAARAVGRANGRNNLAIVIPCHRVIGADGSLTGYASGIERKRWLLSHERVLPG